MKKIYLSTCIFLMSLSCVNAQNAAKSVFFELGGPGLASINYDMRFQKKEDGLGFRVGVGGFSVSSDYGNGREKTGVLLVPVGLNYLLTKDKRHYFEIGAGATYVHLSNKSQEFENDQFSTSFGHLHFGYRLQPVDGGFTFRAGVTPIFNRNGFVPYYASISFGYKF